MKQLTIKKGNEGKHASKKYFKQVALGYFLFLIIPILVLGTSIYYFTVKTIKTNAKKMAEGILEMQKQSLQYYDDELFGTLYNISKTSTINILDSLSEQNSPFMQYADIVDTLNNIQTKSKIIDSLFVMDKDMGYIITSESKYTLNSFFQYHYVPEYYTQEQIIEEFMNTKGMKYRYFGMFSSAEYQNHQIKDIIWVAFKNPNSSSELVYGAIINLNNYIDGISKNTLSESRMILLEDAQANKIYDNVEGSKTDLHNIYEGVNITNDFFVLNTRDNTSKLNWNYLIPKREIIKEVENINDVILIIIISLLIIGAMMSILASRKLAKPIEEIFSYISSKNKNNGIGVPKGEIDYISKTVHETMEKNEELESYINKNKGYLILRFVFRIAKGFYAQKNTILSSMEELNIVLDHKYYSVGILRFNNSQAVMEEMDDKVSYSFRDLQIEAKEFIEGYFTGSYKVLIGFEIDRLLCLFNHDDDISDEVYKMVVSLNEVMLKRHNLELSCGLGETYDDIIDSKKSYLQADKALSDIILDEKMFFNKYDYSSQNLGVYWFPQQIQNMLSDSLKVGDFDKCNDIVNNIIDTNVENDCSAEYLNQIFMQLLSINVSAIYEVGATMDDWNEPSSNLFSQYRRYDSLEKKREFIITKYDKACKAILQKKTEEQEDKEPIIDYIKQNYTKDISLIEISQNFNLSAGHFSRRFKEIMGTTFIDYLNHYRIEAAIPLFNISELPIKEIASQVGFRNYKSFTRSFKKYCSISPESYRKLHS